MSYVLPEHLCIMGFSLESAVEGFQLSLLSHCINKWNDFYNPGHKELLCLRVAGITLKGLYMHRIYMARNMYVLSIFSVLPRAIHCLLFPHNKNEARNFCFCCCRRITLESLWTKMASISKQRKFVGQRLLLLLSFKSPMQFLCFQDGLR